MQKAPTHFLRFVIFLVSAAVLALCIFGLPSMWKGGSAEFPMASMSVQAIVIGMYLTAIAFYAAVWHVLKLLSYIDQNKAFSELSVAALGSIKRCGIAISIIYVAFVPLLFPIADADDAPGLIIIGTGIACMPIAVTVFVAVLQRLLQAAIDFKSENELTV